MTKEEVAKLASLSKIKLTEKEIEQFSNDMETIISSVDTLDSFEKDTGIKIKIRKLNEISFSMLREDKVKPGLEQSEVLANAPFTEDGYIKVHGDTVGNDSA